MEDIWKKKYLKYKNKYLDLKQIGGARREIQQDYLDFVKLIKRKTVEDLRKIQIQKNYLDNLSDHKIITCIKDDILLISFNVEHFKEIKERLPGTTPSDFQRIIDTKNRYICIKLQEILDLSHIHIRKVILNIQEGYPSIYRKLVNDLKFRGINGKPTKLICQNLYEGWIRAPITGEPPESLLVRAKFFETEYDKHTRGWLSSCFFSIVFDNSDPPQIDYLLREPDIGEPIDDINYPYEVVLSKHILRNQQTCDQQLFITSHPVLLYFDLYKEKKGQINKGTVILSCKGIHFSIDEYDFINIHLTFKGYNIYDKSRIEPLIEIIKLNQLGFIEKNFDRREYDGYNDIYTRLVLEYGSNIRINRQTICLGDFNVIGNIVDGKIAIYEFDDVHHIFTELTPLQSPNQGFDHFIELTTLPNSEAVREFRYISRELIDMSSEDKKIY